jgi:hypothetical protein
VIIKILDLAERDLIEGFRFYEAQEAGLGSYFLTNSNNLMPLLETNMLNRRTLLAVLTGVAALIHMSIKLDE